LWPRYVETSVIAWLAKTVVRRRWLVLVAWRARGALPTTSARVQQVLAVRGGSDEETESFRAAQLLKQAFPALRGVRRRRRARPISRGNRRFDVVLDTLAAAMRRRPYVREVVAASSLASPRS